MLQMLESFFHIPTVAEATALKAAGQLGAFNVNGIIAWSFFKLFFVIYTTIGLLMFLWWVYGGIRDAYKLAYANDNTGIQKEDFEYELKCKFEDFFASFFIHIFIWPVAVYELISNIDFKFSKVIPYFVDKWDRHKRPEKYI